MKKKIIKRSVVVACCFALFLSCIPGSVFAAQPVDVVVNWNEVKQEIDGFGVTQEEECTYVMQEPVRSQVMDLLFSPTNGIGLSLLRTEIGCGESKPTIEPSKGVWNTAPDVREIWYFNEAKARGVQKIYGTVWSPPAWMKTNNSVTNGGFLKSSCYQDYADYLTQYVKIYKNYHNIDIFGVSIANEPEYAAKWKSCLWTSAQYKNFIINYLYPTFQREGISAKIMAGESGFWSESHVKPTLQDPVGVQALDIVTAHQYQGTVGTLPVSAAAGKKIWQSELCETTSPFSVSIGDAVKWAKKVHSFMTIPSANAFFYWRGAHTTDSNQTLIRLDTNNSYTVSKRLFAIGHYSKFVRPGYVRVGVTEKPYSDTYVTAYKNNNSGDFSVVVVNGSDSYNRPISVSVNGANVGYMTPYVTDLNNNMQKLDDVPVINGKCTLFVGSKSIVTLVGKAGSVTPPAKTYTLTDTLDNVNSIYSKSSGWMIETGNDYGRYDNDASCLRRTQLSTQEVVYKINNMTEFKSTMYFCDNTDGITFYTSSDGVTFNSYVPQRSPAVYTAKDWNRIYHYGNVPAGTNYLKIEFSGGVNEWNKHLAEISFN